MDRFSYYESLKTLARTKRAAHGVDTSSFGLRAVGKIYRAEGIRIDEWDLPYRIRALYMCADGECSVAIQRLLPRVPRLFALVHELKHHYCDRELLSAGTIACGNFNANQAIEIGAEVFAAEFIYPEAECAEDVERRRVDVWTPEAVVELKRRCRARVSYRFLCKRLERMRLVERGQFDSVKFQKLEEQLFGAPLDGRPTLARLPKTARAR